MLTTYLQAANAKKFTTHPRHLYLRRKTLSFCSTHDACNVVQIFSLNAREMHQWIKDALDRIPSPIRLMRFILFCNIRWVITWLVRN